MVLLISETDSAEDNLSCKHHHINKKNKLLLMGCNYYLHRNLNLKQHVYLTLKVQNKTAAYNILFIIIPAPFECTSICNVTLLLLDQLS